MTIKLTIDMSDLTKGLQKHIDKLEDSRTIHSIVAKTLLTANQQRFRKGVGPNNKAWKKLHPITLANRQSKKGILRVGGDLFRSIHDKASSDKAEVGTNLDHPKVWVNFYGATIRPRRKNSLAIPNGNGGVILAKKVTIPARPYLGINSDDEKLIQKTLVDYLSEK